MRQRTRYGVSGETLDSLTSVGEANGVAMSQTATGSIVASGVRLRKGATPHIGGFLVKFLRKET